MPWCIFDRRANQQGIPHDSFVFWSVLEPFKLVSSVDDLSYLWCFQQSDVCLGASLMDSELWGNQLVSAMWRFVDGKLTLIREMEETSFPELRGPAWLLHQIESKVSVSKTK